MFEVLHCPFRGLQELVFVGLYFYTVGHFHDKSPGDTRDQQ